MSALDLIRRRKATLPPELLESLARRLMPEVTGTQPAVNVGAPPMMRSSFMDENPPQGGAIGNIGSILRALVPTDSLPPVNRDVMPAQPNLSRADLGDLPFTRPRLVNPSVTPPVDLNRVPVAASEPNVLPPMTRPTEAYPFKVPSVYNPNDAAIPVPIGDTSLQRISRNVNPVDPYLKAYENKQSADSSPLDFGQDKFGNQRTEAKRGFWGRLGAGGKRFAKSFLRGEGVLNAAAEGIEGIANPDSNAKERLMRRQAENNKIFTGEIGRRKVETDIEGDQTMNDLRRAQVEDLPLRREQAAQKIANKQEYDQWRMKSGDRKADTYENWLEWRKANGDNTLKTRQEYQEWQRDIGERRLTEQGRHNVETEGIARANVGARTGQAEVTNAVIDQQVPALKAEQAANEKTANDPKADAYTRDQARKRAQVLRDQVGRVERGRKAAPTRATQGRSTAAPTPVNEADIRALFPNDPAKQEEALRRARARKDAKVQ